MEEKIPEFDLDSALQSTDADTHSSLTDSSKAVGSNRRNHPRRDVQLALTLKITIPEDSIGFHVFRGRTSDVSLRGMRICVTELPKDLYSKLLKQKRAVDIEFQDRDGELRAVSGHIAWMDYRIYSGGNGAGPCQFGVALTEDQHDKLRKIAEGGDS